MQCAGQQEFPTTGSVNRLSPDLDRIIETEGLQLYLKPSGYTSSVPRGGESGSNGLLLDPEGRLVLCQHGERRMAIMNSTPDKPKVDFTTLADWWCEVTGSFLLRDQAGFGSFALMRIKLL